MNPISEIFSNRIIQIRGQEGRRWLEALPASIAYAEERWQFKVLAPFALSYNFVAPVAFNDHTEAVLKICIPGYESINEINVLKLHGGFGMCRLLDFDLTRGMLLLERLDPGNNLLSIRSEGDAIKIAAGLIRDMRDRKISGLISFPTVSDLAVGITNLRDHYTGDSGPFDEMIVRKAESLFSELIASQSNCYLLHGDFHHENILLSDDGWKLIDPKGVVGEMEYEVIPFLMNNLPDKNLEHVIDNRVLLFSRELDVNRDRIMGWGLCHSLLAAWWNIEDNLGLSARDLAILRYFHGKTQ
jgi:streptomycin 6-kinase